MVTTINNKHRVFLVRDMENHNNKAFCNLQDVPTFVRAFGKPKVWEFWNNALKPCSKTWVNELLEANQLKQMSGSDWKSIEAN